MTDQVLTPDETSALLEGMSSGAVEVHDGAVQRHADVQPFAFGPHARIQSNSYPRLKLMNEQLAKRLGEYLGALLHADVGVTAQPSVVRRFSDHAAALSALSAANTFTAAPLAGKGLVVLDEQAISELVEAYFGGSENEPVRNTTGSLSSGEVAVCRLFADTALTMVKEIWEPVIALSPERTVTEVGVELVEAIGPMDLVLGTRFSVGLAGGEAIVAMLWPMAMLQPLLPVLEGRKRDRVPGDDARWEKAIRSRLPDTAVSLTGAVSRTRVPLSALTGLAPGDVIRIADPRKATVLAGTVPLMSGRFGVHAGRNAIETTGWAAPARTDD